jgi:enamine deaminase RidA (YjgF/YER057c/UK114 family)
MASVCKHVSNLCPTEFRWVSISSLESVGITFEEDLMSGERRHISSGSTFERDIGYARAVIDGDWIFISGTTGFDYRAGTIADSVTAQAEQCISNIAEALAEAGSSFRDAVRVRYIFPDASDFEPCWPLLREAFGEAQPAATMISAGLADPRMKIEIEVTAKRRKAVA